MKKITVIAGVVLLLAGGVRAQDWKVLTSGIDTNLRGVSAAWPDTAEQKPEAVIWAAGSNGVVLRSMDEGKSWKRLHVAGGETLDFRGIQAINQKTAYLMASGEGEKSRIYKTTDGGANWQLQYTDKRKEFFLDAIVCESEMKCFALGDPIDGKFVLLKTEDGKHWTPLPTDQMPAAIKGEGAFAASNSALALGEGEDLFFATGGSSPARVFYSPNGGQTWSAFDTPILAGIASAGIFSIEAKERKAVVAVGGDYKKPEQARDAAAYSESRGEKWMISASPPGGYRSGVASVDGTLFVAVGPNGTDISLDAGKTWKKSDLLNLNAICVLDIFHAWAAGANGTIARFKNPRQYEVENKDEELPVRAYLSAVVDCLRGRGRKS